MTPERNEELEAAFAQVTQERDRYLALNQELVRRDLPTDTLNKQARIVRLEKELEASEAARTRLLVAMQAQIEEWRKRSGSAKGCAEMQHGLGNPASQSFFEGQHSVYAFVAEEVTALVRAVTGEV